MPRLTERVRDGLHELAAIGETVLEANGEGWALECRNGPDHEPCKLPTCETCVSYENVQRACEYVRHIANKQPK